MIIMNKRDYIFYIQEHRKGVQKHPKRLKCGAGLFMRWDCIRFFIEEDLGLHNKGKQESFIEGEIKNVSNINLKINDYLFHAGTIKENNTILATGGRVLNFVCLSESFKESRNNIHNHLKKLNWAEGFFRKDIGYKVID